MLFYFISVLLFSNEEAFELAHLLSQLSHEFLFRLICPVQLLCASCQHFVSVVYFEEVSELLVDITGYMNSLVHHNLELFLNLENFLFIFIILHSHNSNLFQPINLFLLLILHHKRRVVLFFFEAV